jgi:hypothetical protein
VAQARRDLGKIVLHRHRVIDLACAGLEIALLLFFTPLAVLGKSYIAATIIAVVLGGTAFGHIKGRQWAARTTLYIVFIGNALAIFGLFPLFDESTRPELPFGLRVAIMIGVTAGCVTLLTMLYLRLRPERIPVR